MTSTAQQFNAGGMPGASPGAIHSQSTHWQTTLLVACQDSNLQAPIYTIVSDRRGGRTAWSATVTLGKATIEARYWYDGQYLNNAKEDAAEVALQKIWHR